MKKVLVLLLTIFLLISLIAPSIYAKPETGRGDNLRLRVFVHYPRPDRGKKPPKPPRPPKPPAGPACEVTGSDQVDHYLLAGWHMPTGGVTYKVNFATAPKNVRAGAEAALDSAFAAWTNADGDKVSEYDGETRTRAAKFDGQNIIAWKGIDSSAIAITYVWYWVETKELAEVDTMFNKNLPWAITAYSTDCGGDPNAFDIQNIATHEFGHWVGLDDLYADLDSELTMYGYGALGELKKDTLGAGDISGVLAVAP